MYRKLVCFLIEYRQWHLALYTLLLLALVPFMPGLSYTNDLTDYFENNDKRVLAFDELQSEFGDFNNVIIFVEAGGDDFHHLDSLIALEEITRQIESLSDITSIQSLTRHGITRNNGGELETVSFSEMLNNPEKSRAAGFSAELGSVAGIRNRLVSPDFSVAAVIANVNPSRGSDFYDQIEAVVDQSQQIEGFRLFLWGSEAIKHEISISYRKDLFTLTPLILLAGIFVLWVTIRSFLVIVAGLVSVILAQCLTVSVSGAFSFSLNQTSSMAFGLVFVLTLADIIHILATYLIGLKDGMVPRLAMEQSLVKNIKPIFLTTLTTMLGFLSLNFSDSPPFAVLGNVAAIGLFSALCSAIMVVPCLCLALKPTIIKAPIKLMQDSLLKLCHFSLKYRAMIVIVFIVATVIFAVGIFNNRFHNDPLDYFASSSPVSRATEFAVEKFDTKHYLMISVDTGSEGGLFRHYNMATINHFVEWLQLQPSVTAIHSAVELFKTVHGSLNDNNLKWHTLPQQEERLSDYYALYHMSLKEGASGIGVINNDESKSLIVVSLKPLYSNELITLAATIDEWFNENAPRLEVTTSGNSLMFAAIGVTLIENMMEGAVFTIGIITLVLMFSFGSLKIGFFSLLPNLIPAVIAYGAWGLFVGKLDIAAASTFSLSLGIVVDDTIHFLLRYIDSRKSGLSPMESIEECFAQVGPALLLTTLVLAIGLTVFSFSIFEPNATIAKMMLCTTLLALAFDFLLLPLALLKFDPWLIGDREKLN